jgi:hypothetical protein
LNALFRAGKEYRRRWPENIRSENSPVERSEKEMAKKEGFFNHWIDESISYKRNVSAFVRLIFTNGAFNVITRLLFRLVRGIKRLKDVIRF